jgi:hypothetical protein
MDEIFLQKNERVYTQNGLVAELVNTCTPTVLSELLMKGYKLVLIVPILFQTFVLLMKFSTRMIEDQLIASRTHCKC